MRSPLRPPPMRPPLPSSRLPARPVSPPLPPPTAAAAAAAAAAAPIRAPIPASSGCFAVCPWRGWGGPLGPMTLACALPRVCAGLQDRLVTPQMRAARPRGMHPQKAVPRGQSAAIGHRPYLPPPAWPAHPTLAFASTSIFFFIALWQCRVPTHTGLHAQAYERLGYMRPRLRNDPRASSVESIAGALTPPATETGRPSWSYGLPWLTRMVAVRLRGRGR